MTGKATKNYRMPEAMLPPIGSSYQRIAIDHKASSFTMNDMLVDKDRMSNVIILGAFRNRVMNNEVNWSNRECWSPDGERGIPDPGFPVSESNFPDDYVNDIIDGKIKDRLECGSCIFSNWNPNPTNPRKSVRPRCALQVVMPMLIPPQVRLSELESMEIFTGSLAPDASTPMYTLGFAYFQKSAEGPSVKYIKRYAKEGVPMYSTFSAIALNSNIGGTGAGNAGFRYSTPAFARGHDVPEMFYIELSRIYNDVKRRAQTPVARKPVPKATGGMLSVPTVETDNSVYTGGFFK